MKHIQETNDICKEVLMLLAHFKPELIEKIPNNVFEKLKLLAADSQKEIYIDPQKEIDAQNVSEESKDLLLLIYYNCVADGSEKKQLLDILKM